MKIYKDKVVYKRKRKHEIIRILTTLDDQFRDLLYAKHGKAISIPTNTQLVYIDESSAYLKPQYIFQTQKRLVLDQNFINIKW